MYITLVVTILLVNNDHSRVTQDHQDWYQLTVCLCYSFLLASYSNFVSEMHRF